MGGGAGFSKGSSRAESGMYGRALAYQLEKETSPLRGTVFQQMTEALRTGGVGALIPLISRSVEANRTATSDTMRTMGSELATANAGATPYGKSILSQILLSGNQSTNAIGPNLAFQIGQGAPQTALGATDIAQRGLSAAAQSHAWNFAQNANVGAGG